MAMQQFLEQAQIDHATAAAAVAARLPEGFALLAAEPDEAEAFARFTEHVVLGHLDNSSALAQWIERLRPFATSNAGLANTLARSSLALALAQGEAPNDTVLSAGERVRAYGNALLALTRRGAWSEIRAMVSSARELAESAGDPAASKALGAITNNLAGDLRFYYPTHRADPDYAAVMVDAARLALAAWCRVGGWLEQQRADYQLAMCLAATGEGDAALAAAASAWRTCEANDADDEECFYALEAVAHAQCAAGELTKAHEIRAKMADRLARMPPSAQAYAVRQLAPLDLVLGETA